MTSNIVALFFLFIHSFTVFRAYNLAFINIGIIQNPSKKYNLQYYLDLAEKIVGMGCHIIGLKDSQFIAALCTM